MGGFVPMDGMAIYEPEGGGTVSQAVSGTGCSFGKRKT